MMMSSSRATPLGPLAGGLIDFRGFRGDSLLGAAPRAASGLVRESRASQPADEGLRRDDHSSLNLVPHDTSDTTRRRRPVPGRGDRDEMEWLEVDGWMLGSGEAVIVGAGRGQASPAAASGRGSRLGPQKTNKCRLMMMMMMSSSLQTVCDPLAAVCERRLESRER